MNNPQILGELFSRIAALEEKKTNEEPLISVGDLMAVCQCIKNELPVSEEVRNLIQHAPVVVEGCEEGDLLQYDKFFLYQVAVSIYKDKIETLKWDLARERAHGGELVQQLQVASQLSVTNKRLEDETERLRRDLRHSRDTNNEKKRQRDLKEEINGVRKEKMAKLDQLKQYYRIPPNTDLSLKLDEFMRDVFRDVLHLV